MRALNSQKIVLRVLSATLLIPVVLLVVFQGGYVFGALLGVVGGLALSELWRMALLTKYKWAVFIVSAIYVMAGVVFCYHLREVHGIYLTLVFFGAIWASDIAAYFFGKCIGGAKMSPDISPNKTWAGYVGALLAPALVLGLGGILRHQGYEIVPALLFGGVALGVVAQAGDLFMSSIKRFAHVKDSGDLIPGHGGVLDRIDSLVPAVVVYLALIKAGIVVW